MTPEKSPTEKSPAALPKPTLPPFWKWLTRITAAVALTLFLVPTVYVVKYYAVDRPREVTVTAAEPPLTADSLAAYEVQARHGSSEAVRAIGQILHLPLISVKRPLECLSAKATLADLAVHASDPVVRAAASDELGKVAQSGAVIRR